MLRRRGMPAFENIMEFVPKDHRSFYDSAFWVRQQMDKGLDWDKVARIRALWPRKLLIKGLLRPGTRCGRRRPGRTASCLSDHGGRQVDSAISPIESLPEARRLVGDQADDPGGWRHPPRCGRAKALRARADAVQIGRPRSMASPPRRGRSRAGH